MTDNHTLERALREPGLATTLAEQGKRKLLRDFNRDLWVRRIIDIYASAGVSTETTK